MFNLITLHKYILVLVVTTTILAILPSDAFAAFDSLRESGMKIFYGLRSIIYPASAVGIICVCIGGFFGNMNWKWLTAVVVGLIVISLCGGFIGLFIDSSELNRLDSTSTLSGG